MRVLKISVIAAALTLTLSASAFARPVDELRAVPSNVEGQAAGAPANMIR